MTHFLYAGISLSEHFLRDVVEQTGENVAEFSKHPKAFLKGLARKRDRALAAIYEGVRSDPSSLKKGREEAAEILSEPGTAHILVRLAFADAKLIEASSYKGLREGLNAINAGLDEAHPLNDRMVEVALTRSAKGLSPFPEPEVH